MDQNVELFSAASLAAAPLTITQVLSGQVAVSTTVSGEARQYATVSILNGSASLWSTTLTQFNSTAVTPYDIVAGQITISEGCGFTLTIPTSIMQGAVVANLTITTPTTPKGNRYTITVASWGLSSAS